MRTFAAAFGSLVLALSLAPLAACDDGAAGAEDDLELDGPPQISGEEGKADGEAGVELMGRLRPGTPVDGKLSASVPRVGYLIYAEAGATVKLEVTKAGTDESLDTVLKLYGVRRADGTFPGAIARNDDGGHAKLSLIKGTTVPSDGFYLVEVATKTTLTASKPFRVALSCSGTCDSELTAAPVGMDVRWTQTSAEYRAATLQAYATATRRIDELADGDALPSRWGVVLDLDETVLSNATYQRERAELGVAYSTPSWFAWVARREATPIPGAKAFLEHVRARGGKIAFVTNRKLAGECAPTEDVLRAEALPYDAIFCRGNSSDKNARFAEVARGTNLGGALEIVAFVGDNIQDFPELKQDVRFDDDGAFAEFGERFFLIPNAMYGSWEKNE